MIPHSGAAETDTDMKNDVVSFYNDTQVLTNTEQAHHDQEFLSDFREPSQPSIEGVLERPVLVAKTSWSSEDKVGTKMALFSAERADIILPQDLCKASKPIRSKLRYFQYLRSAYKVKVVINATPFFSGKLWISYHPYEDYAAYRGLDSFGTVTRVTGFQGVELDLGCADSAELEVPYISPLPAIDLTTSIHKMMRISAYIMAPLRCEGSGHSVQVKFYLSFSKPVLSVPTIRDLSPDLDPDSSNNSWTARSVFHLDKDYKGLLSGSEVEIARASQAGVEISFKTPYGRHRKYTLTLPEALDVIKEFDGLPADDVPTMDNHTGVEGAKQSKLGIISGPASIVKSIADPLKNVPLIGEVARDVSWVAEWIARGAKYFGFSKPSNASTPVIISNIPGRGYTQTDNMDNSVTLGPLAAQSISGYNRFGTARDEMHISNIISKLQYVNRFSWNKIFPENTVLMQIPVHPMWATDHNSDSKHPIGDDSALDTAKMPNVTNMGYVASMFKYWKGSITYRFSFAKTAYHSGRIRVTWVPGDGTSLTATEQANALAYPANHTRIYDLRDSNEFTFTVPYLSNRPALKVTDMHQSDWNKACNGKLLVTVETQLKAPETVSGLVDMNVWMAGGPDMQFFHPDFSTYVPLNCVPSVADKVGVVNIPSQTAHTGYMEGEHHTLMDSNSPAVASSISSANASHDFLGTAKQIFGEATVSLRALTRRFGLDGMPLTESSEEHLIVDPANFHTALNGGKKFAYFTEEDPTKCQLKKMRVCSMPPAKYISQLYRFYTGGIRYKFDTSTTFSGRIFTRLDDVPRDSAIADFSELTKAYYYGKDERDVSAAGGFCHTTGNILTNMHEVELPYQRPCPISVLTSDKGITGNTRHMLLATFPEFSTNVKVYPMMAAADDHSFGTLIGAPPIARIADVNIADQAVCIDTPKPAPDALDLVRSKIGQQFTFHHGDGTTSQYTLQMVDFDNDILEAASLSTHPYMRTTVGQFMFNMRNGTVVTENFTVDIFFGSLVSSQRGA